MHEDRRRAEALAWLSSLSAPDACARPGMLALSASNASGNNVMTSMRIVEP